MARIKCMYTETPLGTLAGNIRWVDPATGHVYLGAEGGNCLNASGVTIAAANSGGTYEYPSVAWPDAKYVLTPVTSKEVPLTDSKCPIRSQFIDADITTAYSRHGIRRGAEQLSASGTEVSRQLFRFWCIDLGIHVPKSKRAAQAVEQKRPASPRILLIDIETAPILGYVWSLWKQNVGLNQIKEEWYILSYCAKWLHEPEIMYRDVRENPHSDESLMKPLWELLDEADIIIGQNGKAFDMPKIQARLIMAGHMPPRPYKVIDTLIMAKQQFRFTSNKLEWMTGESAGLTTLKKNQHSKFPGFSLWAECLKGNPEAWDEMKEYNIPDVTSMEELYLKLRPWYVGHPNLAAYVESTEVLCPKCLSPDIKQHPETPFTYTQTGKYEMYHCSSCGGFSRGRYSRNDKVKSRALLSN